MDKSDEKFLHQLYYNPKHRSAFAGANKLWSYVKQLGRNISRKQVYQWLSKQDVYTSHHPILHRFARRQVVTRGIDDIWDADLMDMSNLSNKNDDIQFLGIFIDIFSRYLYAIPMKTKSTRDTLDAIKQVIKIRGSHPDTLRCDAGKEFVGKLVHDYLLDREVYQQVTRNDGKANYAERVIRTLKKRIYRYMYANKTERYIDALGDIVQGYNDTYHSSIGCSPSSVNRTNETRIWAHQYLKPSKSASEFKKVKFKFSPGNLVRISNYRSPFSRGFGQTFSEELFKVRSRFGGYPITYVLEDLHGETVSGLFYEPELVLVTGKDKNSQYSVEKILRHRIRNGKKQVLIKWKGYSNSFNSWEPIENLASDLTKNG